MARSESGVKLVEFPRHRDDVPPEFGSAVAVLANAAPGVRGFVTVFQQASPPIYCYWQRSGDDLILQAGDERLFSVSAAQAAVLRRAQNGVLCNLSAASPAGRALTALETVIRELLEQSRFTGAHVLVVPPNPKNLILASENGVPMSPEQITRGLRSLGLDGFVAKYIPLRTA